MYAIHFGALRGDSKCNVKVKSQKSNYVLKLLKTFIRLRGCYGMLAFPFKHRFCPMQLLHLALRRHRCQLELRLKNRCPIRSCWSSREPSNSRFTSKFINSSRSNWRLVRVILLYYICGSIMQLLISAELW